MYQSVGSGSRVGKPKVVLQKAALLPQIAIDDISLLNQKKVPIRSKLGSIGLPNIERPGSQISESDLKGQLK